MLKLLQRLLILCDNNKVLQNSHLLNLPPPVIVSSSLPPGKPQAQLLRDALENSEADAIITNSQAQVFSCRMLPRTHTVLNFFKNSLGIKMFCRYKNSHLLLHYEILRWKNILCPQI